MMTVQVRIILMMMVMMIVIVMVMMMVGRRNEVGVRRTVTIPRLLRARAAKSRPALAPLSFHFLALAQFSFHFLSLAQLSFHLLGNQT